MSSCVAMETSSLRLMAFFLLVITHSRADKYTITGCSSDGYIDVREDTGTTITCDGIQGLDYNIYWALSGNRIGDCGYPNPFDYCWLIDPSNTNYQLSRPSASQSDLRILKNFRSKPGDTIMCSQRNNATQVFCRINTIYPGRPTNPTLSTDGVTWTVSGSMRVEKMYSSINQYSCIWTQENETQYEIRTERVTPDLNIFHESDHEFNNGNCSLSWPLPTEEGRYTINLTVVPGEIDKSYSAGTFVIEHPGDPEIHCDVRPGLEKSDVTCQCRPSSTKAGSPAPSLSWPGFSNSSQLRLINMWRVDDGTQFTCRLTWGPNDNIVKTAIYMLQGQMDAIYPPPSAPQIIGYDPGQVLRAGSSVTLICTVSSGNPRVSSVNFTCGGHADEGDARAETGSAGSSYVSSRVTISNVTVEDSGTVCICSASWAAAPSTYLKTATVSLVVADESSVDKGVSVAAVGGGVGAAVVVVIIIIIVVLVIKYKRRSKAYDHTQVRKKEDPHTYMDVRPAPSATTSISSVALGDYNEVNFAMEEQSFSGEMNAYDNPKPRGNGDAYLYTDLTPSVTDSGASDATRACDDYDAVTIAKEPGSTRSTLK